MSSETTERGGKGAHLDALGGERVREEELEQAAGGVEAVLALVLGEARERP